MRVFVFQRISDFLCWNCLRDHSLHGFRSAGDQSLRRQQKHRGEVDAGRMMEGQSLQTENWAAGE